MDARELGRKIREARISKSLTQSEVVGDFITRNMLSQIESGTATPSMKTLEYLSVALSVPMAQLVPSTEHADVTEGLILAKQALHEKKYELVLELAGGLAPPFRDEAEAMQARAHLALARILAQTKEFGSAALHARSAAETAQRGVYASREIRSEALLLLDETDKFTKSDLD